MKAIVCTDYGPPEVLQRLRAHFTGSGSPRWRATCSGCDGPTDNKTNVGSPEPGLRSGKGPVVILQDRLVRLLHTNAEI